MAFKAPLTYKGRPLVRCKNQLYYGSMTDPFVVFLQVLTTKEVDGVQLADRVHLSLLSTDASKPIAQRMLKQTNKNGLYHALEFADIMLQNAESEAG